MKIERKISPELDNILGQEFKILDHGFITNLTNKYNISKGTLYNIKNNQCYLTVK